MMTITFETGSWTDFAEPAKVVRFAVFVQEQHVPEALELDEHDPVARHVVAFADDAPIGTGRILADGHIGRLAVLPAYRGRHIGQQLLETLVTIGGSQGFRELHLNAQLQALPFYQRLGWIAEGPVFDDAGIPHRAMRLRLP